MVSGFSGTILYDVGDPVHPRAVCRITNSSAHLLIGTAVEYLVPQPNGTTSVVLRSLTSNNEGVAATFPVDLKDRNLSYPWPPISWLSAPSVLAYTTDGGTDSMGFAVTDVWTATAGGSSKVNSYSVPGRDAFGRPGFPPITLAFSPDGGYLVSGWLTSDSFKVVRLPDRVDVTPPMPSGVRFAFWSRTGHALYIVGDTVKTWTPESGESDVSGTIAWTLDPSFSPDSSQVVFTALTTSRDVRVYVYDIKTKASRLLVDQPRSKAFFVKSGWVWELEEKPCVQADNSVCFDPTVPDGNVLAFNLATGQESLVTFAPGESPVQANSFYLAPGDLWPLS